MVPEKSPLKVPGEFKASKLSQFGHFLFYCPFKKVYFSSVDHEMGVRLQEVSAYPR